MAMKKKLLSFILALCMVLSTAATLTFAGYATETTPSQPSNDGKTFAEALAAGDTTLNIDDQTDWAAFVTEAESKDFAGKTIKLNIDVTLNDGESFKALTTTDFTGVKKWMPIPLFAGTFNGGNHTISGMYVEGQGFATQMKNVTICNLKFDNCYVVNNVASTGYGKSETGILTGYISWDSGSTITNVHTSNSKVQCTDTNEGVGGIVGMAGGKTLTISNCTNGATVINGGSTVSGQNLLASGGIVGASNNTLIIENCKNTGDVSADGANNNTSAGGIYGGISATSATITIRNCKNEGKISAYYAAGGITGKASSKITVSGCVNTSTATVKSLSRSAGGIMGLANHDSVEVNTSVNYAPSISATQNVSGIVAEIWEDCKIESCANYAVLNNENGRAAGAVGYSNDRGKVTITDFINEGNVTAKTYAGGVIGQADFTVELTSVINSGNITSNTSYAGGIAATIEKPMTMTDSMNIGSVTGSTRTGGLLGTYKVSTGTFTRCLSLGKVTTTTSNAAFYSAAFIGDFSQTVDNTGKTEDAYDYIVFDNCYYIPSLTVATNNASIYADRAVTAYFDSQGKNIGNFKIINVTGETKTTTLVIGGVTNAGVQYGAGINAYNEQFKRNENDVNLASRAWQGEIYGVSGAGNLVSKGFNFADTWYISNGAPVPVKAAIKDADVDLTKTIAYAGYQEKLDTTEGFDIRLVAGIYSLNYEKVGFELTLIDDGNMYLPNDYSDTKVYKQINAIGEENDVVTAESCNNANYLTAITIEGCPNPADGSFCIIVKPFTTTDDVKSYGTTIVLRVDNGALLSYAI